MSFTFYKPILRTATYLHLSPFLASARAKVPSTPVKDAKARDKSKPDSMSGTPGVSASVFSTGPLLNEKVCTICHLVQSVMLMMS